MPACECGDVGREAIASTQIHVVQRGGVGRDRERESGERGEREGRREEEGKGGGRKTKQERQRSRKGQERFRGWNDIG